MISGRYRFDRDPATPETIARTRQTPMACALQPRVSWDRVHNRLLALPGSQQLALVNGGTIPDTGQYAAYTGNGVRIGELDEEFIYERRVGDTFLLGTNAWRLERIEADRVHRVAGRGGAGDGAVLARRGHRPQLRPRPGHRRVPARAERAARRSRDCLDWLRARVLSRSRTRPAISAITSAGNCSAPAACRPIARSSSRRRAISSATGR